MTWTKKDKIDHEDVQLLTTVGKLEGENTALMEMKLVFVWLGDVKDLNIAALHSHCEPFSCWTVAQREDLDRGGRRRLLPALQFLQVR